MKRFIEFLTDKNGKLSSSRLFMLLVACTFIIEWQEHIWTTTTSYQPSIEILTMVLGVLGFKIFHNKTEKDVK